MKTKPDVPLQNAEFPPPLFGEGEKLVSILRVLVKTVSSVTRVMTVDHGPQGCAGGFGDV